MITESPEEYWQRVLEALAPLRGCGRTKGPRNWKPDLTGVTAVENTIVSTNS